EKNFADGGGRRALPERGKRAELPADAFGAHQASHMGVSQGRSGVRGNGRTGRGSRAVGRGGHRGNPDLAVPRLSRGRAVRLYAGEGRSANADREEGGVLPGGNAGRARGHFTRSRGLPLGHVRRGPAADPLSGQALRAGGGGSAVEGGV
ncbi:MAG: hypothetical protein AVDCRST_MAG89-2688, partial [uncultured Gemmatimonadetes bacterium]